MHTAICKKNTNKKTSDIENVSWTKTYKKQGLLAVRFMDKNRDTQFRLESSPIYWVLQRNNEPKQIRRPLLGNGIMFGLALQYYYWSIQIKDK